MATPVIMPRQGQSVETCILTSLYKSPGDEVKKGDLLFAYETDKASFEEEAPEDGIFLGAFYKEGDEIPVLETVCVLGQKGEDISSFAPAGASSSGEDENEGQEAPPASQQEIKSPDGFVSHKASSGKLRVSPRAKNRALENNVPLEELSGSGPNGRIIDRDVCSWIEQQQNLGAQRQSSKGTGEEEFVVPASGSFVNSAGDFEEEPLSHIRKIIAKSMHRSLQESAQLTHHLSADARNILAARKKAKENDLDLTINDFICLSVVRVLKKFPRVNAHLNGETLKKFNKVHLGLAVDTERGLMVPAVRDADDFNVQGLAVRMRDLAQKCRKGNVDPEVLAPEAASFTVSNLGNYGVEMFTPVLNLPQVAILGVNTIVHRPEMQDDGTLAIVPVIGLSLTYNHQALDGGEATRFLKEMANELKGLDPELLVG
ncbi:MAG: dihydrolipoamide acetyltransferase family protein [Marinilabiliaceae bacterium]